MIYDNNTKKRINHSKSIFIGDHIWLGQHVFILKGAKIGSGSIIGAMSLLSNKKYSSNKIYVGNPAYKKRENIFFIKPNVHRFLDDDIKEYETYNSDEFIYENDDFKIDFEEIDNYLYNNPFKDKLKYLNELSNNKNKNRFYIE